MILEISIIRTILKKNLEFIVRQHILIANGSRFPHKIDMDAVPAPKYLLIHSLRARDSSVIVDAHANGFLADQCIPSLVNDRACLRLLGEYILDHQHTLLTNGPAFWK